MATATNQANRIRLGERIIEAMGGITAARLEAEKSRVYEAAYKAGYSDGNDEPASGTLASFGYLRTTSHSGLRDFTKIDHAKVLETVWTLWQSSPLAKRVLVIKRDFICGHGVTPQVSDPSLAEIVDKFWKNNKLNRGRGREFPLQLFLLGEQCYPVFVRESDGRVLLGYIDPGQIERVIYHPQNVLEPWAVVIGEQIADQDTWVGGQERRVYRIVRQDAEVVVGSKVQQPRFPDKLVTANQANREPWEAEMLKAHGLSDYSGSCFYTKVNSLSNQPRGYSDLLQVADWIDQADETLFALADREQIAGYFSWDVTIIGADEAKIRARAAEIMARPPKKGSANVHNDAETWEMKSPDLNQVGTIETYNALLVTVLGGLGFPRHWFGYGDETNRATAEAQDDPTMRTLEHDQGLVQSMYLDMCEFARDQAEIAGAWREGVDGRDVELPMPEMTVKDLAKLLATLNPLVLALQSAQAAGWIRKETAASAWQKVGMAELGIEYDAAEELEQAEVEQEEQDEQDLERANQELENRMAAQEMGEEEMDDEEQEPEEGEDE